MYILGISAYYHDSSTCLIKNDGIAVLKERFTRIKHDPSFPTKAIQYCLNEAKNFPKELDYIVFEKPFKFERLVETYLALLKRFKNF